MRHDSQTKVIVVRHVCACADNGSSCVFGYFERFTLERCFHQESSRLQSGYGEEKIAISFDAAWGADKTCDIIETITAYDIKANFFVVGFWAEKYPDKLKKLYDSGRFEIGVHSNTHPHMPKLSREKMKTELTACADTISKTIGVKPDLFRPPFGDYSDALLEVAEECGFYTIQWDVDSLDWKGISSEEIAARVLKKRKR